LPGSAPLVAGPPLHMCRPLRPWTSTNYVRAERQQPGDRQSRREALWVPLAFGSTEELVARDEVELVVVTVRVARHREAVVAALDAGKMVLCEWPLARQLSEAEELAARADASGVRTAFGGPSRRWCPRSWACRGGRGYPTGTGTGAAW